MGSDLACERSHRVEGSDEGLPRRRGTAPVLQSVALSLQGPTLQPAMGQLLPAPQRSHWLIDLSVLLSGLDGVLQVQAFHSVQFESEHLEVEALKQPCERFRRHFAHRHLLEHSKAPHTLARTAGARHVIQEIPLVPHVQPVRRLDEETLRQSRRARCPLAAGQH